jgi:Rieske Fe-S protein
VSATPAWKEGFPARWSDDHHVTRREFARSLGAVSCAAFGASVALAAIDALETGGPVEPKRIGTASELPVGACRVFEFPAPGFPCLLIRLGEERWVAFGQRCTHLGCPVIFRREKGDLQCPCHEGYFSAEDGAVLAGPPPRPLPKVTIERRGDELWATAIRR